MKTIAILALAATLIATPALANEAHHEKTAPAPATSGEEAPGTTTQGAMTGQGMMGQGMMGCPMMSSGNPRTEGRLAFLKAELKIAPQQETAWQAYAEALRAIDQRRAKMMMGKDAGGMAKMMGSASAPEAMNARIEMLESHLGDMKAMQAAVSALYGVLDEAQKKTADELLAMPHGMAMM